MTQPGELEPGFMVVQGNRLEDLRDVAVEWMRSYPLAPLENEVILVQSNGIAQWLKLALARDPGRGGGCGIAAALDVQLPARFLWQAYRAVLGDDAVPVESPFDKTRLTWRLMRQLPALLDEPVFQPLRAFLQDDQDLRKRYQLAERLADLFDQYQVYRADWLEDWAGGSDVLRRPDGEARPLDAGQAWQPALWRALLQDLGEERRGQSRAAVHQRFLNKARDLDRRPSGLPRRVIVFGISSLPKQTLEALEALGRYCQVMLYVHNPCEHYWADIIAGKDLLRAQRRRQNRKQGVPEDINDHELHLHAQPLLAAWGKQGRDYIRLLDEHDEPGRYEALFADIATGRIDLFEPHGAGCLLHQLQDDIRCLRPLAETRRQWPPVAADDPSLRFHIAHSPQREVEILHDQLLARFSADPELRPRDVIVMVPDIDTYAPHIQAVFGQLDPTEKRYIPYTLSDQGQRGRDPLLIALERLLRLPQSRFAVSDLLDLLDVPAVRRRFGLDEHDLPLLHRWVEGAGVRWGLNAEQRASLDLPEELEQNTWRFGLRRMLLGYAVGRGQAWGGIEPYDEVGGLEAALAGPLVQLIDALEGWWQTLREEATPSDWAARLRDLLRGLFRAEDGREALTLARLEETLDRWEQACMDADMEEALPLTVVRESWLAAADESNLTQRFLAGAVNFCTLMPMRAIPFKLVCLLGMNDGDYPRSQSPLDFDLMAGDYRPGDRSRREDDRYLFLEALLSARRQLYISWVGASIRDNTERPPSVLVGQLRDHLAAGWRLAGDKPKALLEALTTKHPLQPFSRANFPPDPEQARLFTYAKEWAQVHAAPDAEQTQPALAELEPPAVDTPLGLGRLGSFLRDPARAFFNHRLKVYFDGEEEGSEDQEPFGFNGLQGYQLREQLLLAATGVDPEQAQAALEAELERLRQTGALPLGSLGKVVSRKHLREDVEALLERYQPLRAEYDQGLEAEPIRFDGPGGLAVEDWLADWRCDAAGQRVQLAARAGQLADKQGTKYYALVRPWVTHLAANARGHALKTFVVGTDRTVVLEPLTAETAAEHLHTLLRTWMLNQQAPLPVACKTAFAWLAAEDKGRDPEAAASLVYDGGYKVPAERAQSPYLARAYPNYRALTADGQFQHWVETLYRPLFDLTKPKSRAKKATKQEVQP